MRFPHHSNQIHIFERFWHGSDSQPHRGIDRLLALDTSLYYCIYTNIWSAVKQLLLINLCTWCTLVVAVYNYSRGYLSTPKCDVERPQMEEQHFLPSHHVIWSSWSKEEASLHTSESGIHVEVIGINVTSDRWRHLLYHWVIGINTHILARFQLQLSIFTTIKMTGTRIAHSLKKIVS